MDRPDPRPHGEGGPPLGAAVVLPGGRAVAARALSWSFVGSSGPGGQNVNKRATKAVLRVAVSELGLEAWAAARVRRLAGASANEAGEVVIASDEHRSQSRNREACLERLGELVERAHQRPKARKKTAPSRGAVQRRIDEKKRRGEAKRRRREDGA